MNQCRLVKPWRALHFRKACLDGSQGSPRAVTPLGKGHAVGIFSEGLMVEDFKVARDNSMTLNF